MSSPEPPKPAAPPPRQIQGVVRGFPRIPYDPSKDRELARAFLAKVLVFTLAGSVVAILTLAGGGWVPIKDSLPVLTALIGVVGTALGFYFGGHSGGAK